MPAQKVELGACCWGGGSCPEGVGRAVAVCRRRALGGTGRGPALWSRQALVAAGLDEAAEAEAEAGVGVGWGTPAHIIHHLGNTFC